MKMKRLYIEQIFNTVPFFHREKIDSYRESPQLLPLLKGYKVLIILVCYQPKEVIKFFFQRRVLRCLFARNILYWVEYAC